MPVLLTVGLALLILGVIILLKFPNKPGGRMKLGAMEVSSVGAGLPLIFLGVVCIILYAGKGPIDLGLLQSCGTKKINGSYSGCFDEYFSDLPADRVTKLEVGAGDVPLIGSEQSKDKTFGIILTENRNPIAAIRLGFYAANDLFKVASLVDQTCEPVTDFLNADRPGIKSELQNWDTLEMHLGEHIYMLRLGYDAGIIGSNYFRKIIE